MFSNLKKKIAGWIIKRKISKGENGVKHFNDFVSKANSFLFLLPEENELFLSALDVVKYFKIHRKKCTVILHEVNLNRPELSDYEKISYSEEDAGKFGLPRKEFLNRIEQKEFDVLIDLMFEKETFALALVAFAKAEFKIAFKSPQAELYANLLLPYDLKNPEISYGNLLNSLRMF